MPPRVKKVDSSEKKTVKSKYACSKRSPTSFQMYVGQLVQNKPEKIKLLLARALMNEGYLEDFHGQIHANECIFSYPDSDWYGVYLVDKKGNKYFEANGKTYKKFYFQLEFDDPDTPKDATPVNGTFETPEELLVDGEEIKGCVIKPSGKCGNPETKKKKKKKTGGEDDSDSDSDNEDEETPEQTLQSLSNVSGANKTKTKMPRDYFEGLGSKSLIIDWMIANMKPGEIFKCIQRGSLSAEDVQQAAAILGESSGGGSGPSNADIQSVIQSLTPGNIHGMIRVVTKEEIISAANSIKNMEQRKKVIVSMCKRAGIKKYRYKAGKNGKPGYIIDSDDDPMDEREVLDECATKEENRIKKLIKITSISQSIKNMSKEKLMNYEGGNVPLPYSMMTYVRKFFPLIKKYENRKGLLYGSIPSEYDGEKLYYFKVGDILGKDLRVLNEKMKGFPNAGGMSKEDLMNYEGGKVPLPYSMMEYVKEHFPLIKKYENRGGLLYGSIPSEREGDTLYYYKVGDILGEDLEKLDERLQNGTVSFGGRRLGFGNRRRTPIMRRSIKVLQKDLKFIQKC